MRMALGVMSVGLLVVCAAPGQEKSAIESNPSGWRDLFPDESLKGWTRVAVPPTRPLDPVTQWHVDSAQRFIVCDGDRGHEWLRYDRELANFIFHVEWRLTKVEGTKNYNSGIYVRNNADGTVWHQAQVGARNAGYIFGQTPVNGAPQRINLRMQMKEDRIKEAGEWNAYELRCDGKTITLWVNGAVTSEFTQCEVPKGYLGLEAEGSRIEFRNLMLKELP